MEEETGDLHFVDLIWGRRGKAKKEKESVQSLFIGPWEAHLSSQVVSLEWQEQKKKKKDKKKGQEYCGLNKAKEIHKKRETGLKERCAAQQKVVPAEANKRLL